MMTEDLRLEDIMSEYRFLQIITTPWTELNAYKLGIISSEGKILKTRKSLTESAEKLAYPDKFFALTWTAKRLLERFQNIPNSSVSLIKTLWSLKSEYGGIDPEKYERIMTEYFFKSGVSIKGLIEKENYKPEPGIYLINGRKYKIKNITPIGEVLGVPVYKAGKTVFTYSEARRVSEDGGAASAAPANSVGTGAIAGVSPGQEPPMPKTTATQKRKRIQRRQQERIKKDIQTINIIKPKN
jgi:hypothetical protein